MKYKLPMIFQSERTECGLAVLAMILQYYHRFVSLTTLRQIYSTNLSGMSISHLISIANFYQLKANVVRVELDKLNSISLPAILHWNMNHFVVLKEIKKNKFIIHDPARGVVKESITKLSNHFTGIVLEAKPINSNKRIVKKSKTTYLRDLLRIIPDIRHIIIKLVIFSVLYNAFLLFSPHYLKSLIDKGISNNGVLAMALGYVWFRLLASIAKWCKDYCALKLEVDVTQVIGREVISKLLALPLDYFEKRFLNDIVHRVNSVEQIRQIIFSGLLKGLLSIIMCFILLIYMFYYSFYLACISLGAIVALLPIKIRFITQNAIKTREMILNKAEEQSIFLENIRGIQPIKLFKKESDRYRLWVNKYKRFLVSAHGLSALKMHDDNIKDLFLGLELCLLVIAAVFAMSNHYISIGLFYTFLFYRQLFLESLFSIVEKINEFKLLIIHKERLNDILLYPAPAAQAISLPDNLSIAVNNVSFKYSAFDPFIFKKLNFFIQEGECAALVGPSGVGKTTLLKLLMGLLRPTEGAVIIGNVAAVDLVSANLFSSVMQQDQLLNGNIAQNISFFSLNESLEKVYDCARLAGIYDEIMRMPLGFQTLVGDMGSTLSGGQKQRILLARALYVQPKILFLDEATSHLDVAKEKEVNAAIKSLGMTRVIIAHRPETIKMADRIIKL